MLLPWRRASSRRFRRTPSGACGCQARSAGRDGRRTAVAASRICNWRLASLNSLVRTSTARARSRWALCSRARRAFFPGRPGPGPGPFLLQILDARGERQGEQQGLQGQRQRKTMALAEVGWTSAVARITPRLTLPSTRPKPTRYRRAVAEPWRQRCTARPMAIGRLASRVSASTPAACQRQPAALNARQARKQQATGVQQVMGPACVLPALQQVLAEADHADAPDRQQRQAVKPPGHRPLRPEILETMAADAQGQHQRAGSGQHVPEIGAIAQAGEEEQVVQQQGEDQPVGHAEQQVALAAVFQQFVVAPEPQRKALPPGS